jgi:hypothetical protein
MDLPEPIRYLTDQPPAHRLSTNSWLDGARPGGGPTVMDEYHRRQGSLDKRRHGQVGCITDARRWDGEVGEVGVSRSGDVYQGCHSNQGGQVEVTSRFQFSRQQSL